MRVRSSRGKAEIWLLEITARGTQTLYFCLEDKCERYSLRCINLSRCGGYFALAYVKRVFSLVATD